MSESHPSPAALQRLFFGTEALTDANPAVAHLVPECGECAETASSFWLDGTRPPVVDADLLDGTEAACDLLPLPEEQGREDLSLEFAQVIDRVLGGVSQVEREVAAERTDAERCLPRILGQPFERQLMLVRNSHRFHTWACCEALVDASFERRHDDPNEAEKLARLAVEAASHLDATRYGSPLVRDLQGRCWTSLANARRMRRDHRAASHALRIARTLLLQGTGSPIDDAWVSDVEASLHAERRQFDRAMASVGRSIRIYYGLNERHLLGQALIKKGMICGHSGQVGCEIVLVRFGLGLIDVQRDPRVGLAGWHNLCQALHESGEDRQALQALGRARPLYLHLGDRTNLLRFEWLEGSIAASLGRGEQAEGCLREAREGFLQLGIAFDAAFVSLDLANLLALQGRNSEVRDLASEMIAVFKAHESRQEALAALILLQQAAERQRVTEALLKSVGSSLREAQRA